MEESREAQKYLDASTRQLIWWRYKKHALAMIGLYLIVGLYVFSMFCEFLAPYSKDTRHFDMTYASPTKIRLFDDEGKLKRPFVRKVKMDVDLKTQQIRYLEVAGTHYPIRLFVRGDSYEFWSLWEGICIFLG